jgi:probable phosphoglycerate mutase
MPEPPQSGWDSLPLDGHPLYGTFRDCQHRMPHPTVYYVRHGLTDWNLQGRLQGRRDTPLNARGRSQAARCGEILSDLFARDGRAASDYGYVSSPLLRARTTMDLMRSTLALAPDGYRIDERLAEISFGEWEGLTYHDVLKREPDVVQRRERSKWLFRPPDGETYAEVAARVGAWYAALEKDTVVTAHGGTARALIAHLGVVTPDEAVHHSIDQGVVYLFAGGGLTRYG